jgi:hypothetical protein
MSRTSEYILKKVADPNEINKGLSHRSRSVMKIVNRTWSDEEMELIREAFRAKVIRLGQLLRDSRTSDDKHLQRIRYEYDKYKEFYSEFGGNDPIG